MTKVIVRYERNEEDGYVIRYVNGVPVDFVRLIWSERQKKYI